MRSLINLHQGILTTMVFVAAADHVTARGANLLSFCQQPAKEFDALKDLDSFMQINLALRRGHELYVKKEYDKAIKEFDEAIRLNPKFAKSFYNRGLAWHAKNEPARAINDFDEAIRLEPYDPSHYGARGLAWALKNENDKAIHDFGECIRLDPKEFQAFSWRADLWRKKKEFDKAIADYDQALDLRPKNVPTLINRGIAWHEKNDFQNAVKDFNAAIELDPRNNLAFYRRACSYARSGDRNKAIDDVRQAYFCGFRDLERMRADKDLASIRDDLVFDVLFPEPFPETRKSDWPKEAKLAVWIGAGVLLVFVVWIVMIRRSRMRSFAEKSS